MAAAPKRRVEPAAAQVGKREAILSAALEEFSARGFAAGRLDDVARRAGVAKGTIYLYFRDKETLLQELVRAELSPVVAALEALPIGDLPLRLVAERLVTIFVREIFGTHRKDVIRLVLMEGPRFPDHRRILLSRSGRAGDGRHPRHGATRRGARGTAE